MIHLCLVAARCRKKCMRSELIWQQSSPTLPNAEFQINVKHSCCHSAGILNLFISTSQARMQDFRSLNSYWKGQIVLKSDFYLAPAAWLHHRQASGFFSSGGTSQPAEATASKSRVFSTLGSVTGRSCMFLAKYPAGKFWFPSSWPNTGKSSYKRKPFLAFKLLKRKAFRQHGGAAIADFLRIIAVILLEREK